MDPIETLAFLGHPTILRRNHSAGLLQSKKLYCPIYACREAVRRKPDGPSRPGGKGGSGSIGRVHLIGTGPGDPRLLTLGAVEVMREADVVLYDRLVSESILSYVNPSAERICVGKGRGLGTGSQASIQKQLAHHAANGKRVVRLKGGDPSVFGRVGSELAYIREEGLDVDVIPGITAASGVAADLGFPLTHGGIADGVCFVTGHLGASWVDKAMLDKVTLVVYMGLQELPKLLSRLTGDEKHDAIPAVAVQSGTTPSQRVVWATTHNLLKRVLEECLESPTLVIIGNVVSMSADWPSCQGCGTKL